MLREEVSYKILDYESKLLQIKNSSFPRFLWMAWVYPCKAEQPLRGMELQEKKHKKDYNIQKICLERTFSQNMSVNSDLKATKIIGQRKAFYSREFQSLAVRGKKLLTQTSL